MHSSEAVAAGRSGGGSGAGVEESKEAPLTSVPRELFDLQCRNIDFHDKEQLRDLLNSQCEENGHTFLHQLVKNEERARFKKLLDLVKTDGGIKGDFLHLLSIKDRGSHTKKKKQAPRTPLELIETSGIDSWVNRAEHPEIYAELCMQLHLPSSLSGIKSEVVLQIEEWVRKRQSVVPIPVETEEKTLESIVKHAREPALREEIGQVPKLFETLYKIIWQRSRQNTLKIKESALAALVYLAGNEANRARIVQKCDGIFKTLERILVQPISESTPRMKEIALIYLRNLTQSESYKVMIARECEVLPKLLQQILLNPATKTSPKIQEHAITILFQLSCAENGDIIIKEAPAIFLGILVILVQNKDNRVIIAQKYPEIFKSLGNSLLQPSSACTPTMKKTILGTLCNLASIEANAAMMVDKYPEIFNTLHRILLPQNRDSTPQMKDNALALLINLARIEANAAMIVDRHPDIVNTLQQILLLPETTPGARVYTLQILQKLTKNEAHAAVIVAQCPDIFNTLHQILLQPDSEITLKEKTRALQILSRLVTNCHEHQHKAVQEWQDKTTATAPTATDTSLLFFHELAISEPGTTEPSSDVSPSIVTAMLDLIKTTTSDGIKGSASLFLICLDLNYTTEQRVILCKEAVKIAPTFTPQQQAVFARFCAALDETLTATSTAGCASAYAPEPAV